MTPKPNKVKKVKAWMCVWPDKSRQVVFKHIKVGSRPSGLIVYKCTITYQLPTSK